MARTITGYLAEARVALTNAIAVANRDNRTFTFDFPAMKLNGTFTPEPKELTKAEALELLKSGNPLSELDRAAVVKALEDPAEDDSTWNSSWNSSSC